MPVRIVRAVTYDIRFPTSATGAGADAMNPDPDYSAAYVALETDDPSGLAGHGLTFTIGRGTEVCVAAIEALLPHVVGATVEDLTADLGGLWRGARHRHAAPLARAGEGRHPPGDGGDRQRRLGSVREGRGKAALEAPRRPAAGAPRRVHRLPLHRRRADAEEALAILRRNEATKGEREQRLLAEGFPAYTTSAGWLGYAEESLPERAREALADGFTHLKLKVGGDLERDLRRARLVREAIGPGNRLSLDANQAWGVEQAIEAIGVLSEVDPWWIEEPTSPDDVLGHRRIRDAIAPVRVATGEHVQNRVVFKQLLQLGAIDVCQLDCCRLGGVNEVLAVVLLAAKFGVPICPHAGGVGLCEYAQHVSMFDYVAVSATFDDRVCEFVDHLHEHFVDPVRVVRGRYLAPTTPGYSIEIRPESLSEFAFPDGKHWWKEEVHA